VDDLELAADLVRAAGTLAAGMLGPGLRIERKTSISDLVSAADHAAEDLIATRLRAERPADGIVGEEGAAAPAASGRTWYVDPVDGTYNFLSGLPEWCSAVALDETVGAVYQPAVDELWAGGPGLGTTRNGDPIEPLADRPLAEVSVATYLNPNRLADDRQRALVLGVIRGAATVRMLGSGSVELAAVAAGRLGAYIQPDSAPWDWRPGAALVRGAGGAAEVVAAGGRNWHIAGNRRTVADIVAILSNP
jgi:myo-inositol-1(or 4)-monophosphatase